MILVTQTATNAIFNQVIDTYVAEVLANDVPDAVLDDILNGGEDVTYELLDVTWLLGFRNDRESDATGDAWWDGARAMLPHVAARLSRSLVVL